MFKTNFQHLLQGFSNQHIKAFSKCIPNSKLFSDLSKAPDLFETCFYSLAFPHPRLVFGSWYFYIIKHPTPRFGVFVHPFSTTLLTFADLFFTKLLLVLQRLPEWTDIAPGYCAGFH